MGILFLFLVFFIKVGKNFVINGGLIDEKKWLIVKIKLLFNVWWLNDDLLIYVYLNC